MTFTGHFDAGAVVGFLQELAELSGPGGADRLAWSEGWSAARALLGEHLRDVPVRVGLDSAANLWAVLEGRSPDLLVVGSHLDSVVPGGWLDGALGVAAGLELLRAAAAAGPPPVSLALVDWADEEGVRFGQAMLGSGIATGAVCATTLAGRRDADGAPIDDLLARHGARLTAYDPCGFGLDRAFAYLELHIEQGPVLDDEGAPLAAVSGTPAVRRLPLTIAGRAEHVGPQPQERRQDAALALAHVVLDVRQLAGELGGRTAVTAVRLAPDLPTVIVGDVTASVDLRHHEDVHVEAMAVALGSRMPEIAERTGCRLALGAPAFSARAAPFDDRLVQLASSIARRHGGLCEPVRSGALHDATNVSRQVPTAMLFARSLGGVSHCPQEHSSPADLLSAATAFAELAEAAVARRMRITDARDRSR